MFNAKMPVNVVYFKYEGEFIKDKIMLRQRKTKIVATLGPSSQSYEQIRALHFAGADVFRLNFSHGTHENHQKSVQYIRQIESEVGSPTTILADLQGPKLRIGTFEKGECQLETGQTFTFDQQNHPGDSSRVCLPHPEIFTALQEYNSTNPSSEIDLLLDDGRIRMRISQVSAQNIQTKVIVGGALSDRKGVNVPGVVLPISALTKKDHDDLNFVLSLGVDWIALSFVQRPEDIEEVQKIIAAHPSSSPRVIAKIEKPKALDQINQIITLSDGIMVARGDLGVEMSPEEVPVTQKYIIRACRESGKPVIVATQMLDSMVHSPSPTRAETSDVATAVYDGVDAVMLSAESASGQYPAEAVSMMNRIIHRVEMDPLYLSLIQQLRTSIPQSGLSGSEYSLASDAMIAAARSVAHKIAVTAIVTFTETGNSTLRAARERPEAPIVGLTPRIEVARAMGLFWGTHPATIQPIDSFSEMVSRACEKTIDEKIAKYGDRILILAGIPFGERSGTNIMRIIEIPSSS